MKIIFFADLVFYHRILKCHVIVELKIDKFRHEYASQLNMYLNYFKAEVMQPDDNPPIGILLCTTKRRYIGKVCHCRIRPKYLCTEVHDRTSNRRRNKEVHILHKLLETEQAKRKDYFSFSFSPAYIFAVNRNKFSSFGYIGKDTN